MHHNKHYNYYLSLIVFVLLCGMANLSYGQILLGDDGKPLTIAECLAISKTKLDNGDIKESTRFLNRAATIHWEAKQYDSAIYHFKRSLELNEKIKNETSIIGIHSNLAMIYADKKEYENALKFFELTLEGRRRRNEPVSIISALINTSIVLNNLGQYDKSAVYLEEALDLAREGNDSDQMRSCYGMLAETYEKAGNAEKSFFYFNLYRSFHEMTQRKRMEKVKQSEEEARLQLQLTEMEKKNHELLLVKRQLELKQQEELLDEYDSANKELIAGATKKDLAIRVLEQDKKLKDLEMKEREAENMVKLQQEKSFRNYMMIGLALVLVVVFFVYRSYQLQKKSNRELSAKNDEIVAQQREIVKQKNELEIAFDEIHHQKENIEKSINYAFRIQSALLTSEETIIDLWAKSFIFFQPRDVVSGDFYWFRTLPNGKVLLAALDCTGHGVPGAFMSMIGVNLLNKIVAQGVETPAEIFQHLHHEVSEALHQKDSKNKDGMDASMLMLDPKSKEVVFCGAKNPLVWVDKDGVKEIKGDKFSIGGSMYQDRGIEVKFTNQVFTAESATNLYIFSDGYVDQIGGPERRKYMKKRFKGLVESYYDKPFEQHKDLIHQKLDSWMENTTQVDDILVAAARVNG